MKTTRKSRTEALIPSSNSLLLRAISSPNMNWFLMKMACEKTTKKKQTIMYTKYLTIIPLRQASKLDADIDCHWGSFYNEIAFLLSRGSSSSRVELNNPEIAIYEVLALKNERSTRAGPSHT